MSEIYYQKYLKYKKKYLSLKSQVGSGQLVNTALAVGDFVNQTYYNPSLPPEHTKAFDGFQELEDAAKINSLGAWGKPVGKYNKYDGKKNVSKEVSMNVLDPYGMDYDYDWGYNNIDGDNSRQVSIQKQVKDGDKKVAVYEEPEKDGDKKVTIYEDQKEEEEEEEDEEDEEEEGDENEEDELTFEINGNSYSIALRNFKRLLKMGIIINDNQIKK